jgi:hypothetical protein
MVCIDTACALVEADVGKGWRVGWRSQKASVVTVSGMSQVEVRWRLEA